MVNFNVTKKFPIQYFKPVKMKKEYNQIRNAICEYDKIDIVNSDWNKNWKILIKNNKTLNAQTPV